MVSLKEMVSKEANCLLEFIEWVSYKNHGKRYKAFIGRQAMLRSLHRKFGKEYTEDELTNIINELIDLRMIFVHLNYKRAYEKHDPNLSDDYYLLPPVISVYCAHFSDAESEMNRLIKLSYGKQIYLKTIVYYSEDDDVTYFTHLLIFDNGPVSVPIASLQYFLTEDEAYELRYTECDNELMKRLCKQEVNSIYRKLSVMASEINSEIRLVFIDKQINFNLTEPEELPWK